MWLKRYFLAFNSLVEFIFEIGYGGVKDLLNLLDILALSFIHLGQFLFQDR